MSRKQFHQFLGDVRMGALNEELTAKLVELVTAVQNTNRAGSLSLVIKIVPTKGLAVEIEDEIKTKIPQMPKASTLLFPTVEGNLQTHNPMQKSLDLAVVADGGVKQLNTVNAAGTQPLVQVPGAAPVAAAS